MTTVELKNILIYKISTINDLSFLKAIQTIVDSKVDNKILHLSVSERNEIIESKKEIELGLFTEHDTFVNEIREWLNKCSNCQNSFRVRIFPLKPLTHTILLIRHPPLSHSKSQETALIPADNLLLFQSRKS